MIDPISVTPASGKPAVFRELTTMRVGGAAATTLVATTSDELVRIASEVWAAGDEWMLLAGGSNTVVSEDGFDGSLILIRTSGIEQIDAGAHRRPGTVRLRVQAGHSWDALVDYAVARGYAGIEALSGIPGSAGAAPVQNIGAYGQEISDVLHAITFLDYETGAVSRILASELGLGYRTSVIKQGRLGVVLSLDIDLVANEDVTAPLSAPIQYSQLADALGLSMGDRVPLKELRRAVLRLREGKGMVLIDDDPDSVSAGSFFTNPIVSEAFARELPPETPRWPMQPEPDPVAVTPLEDLAMGLPIRRVTLSTSPRLVKLSAAWLIENSGIPKGFHLPGSHAWISTKHTLALTNRGYAAAEDIAQLARYVQQRVQAEFGVMLQPEPNLVGLEL